jgi:hypothetical protein
MTGKERFGSQDSPIVLALAHVAVLIRGATLQYSSSTIARRIDAYAPGNPQRMDDDFTALVSLYGSRTTNPDS